MHTRLTFLIYMRRRTHRLQGRMLHASLQLPWHQMDAWQIYSARLRDAPACEATRAGGGKREYQGSVIIPYSGFVRNSNRRNWQTRHQRHPKGVDHRSSVIRYAREGATCWSVNSVVLMSDPRGHLRSGVFSRAQRVRHKVTDRCMSSISYA